MHATTGNSCLYGTVSIVACNPTTTNNRPLKAHTPDHHENAADIKHPECMKLVQARSYFALALPSSCGVDPGAFGRVCAAQWDIPVFGSLWNARHGSKPRPRP